MNAEPPPPGKRAALSLVLGLVAICLFVFFFAYPGHDPKPNGLPVAVAPGGQAPPVEGLDVVRVRDEAEIRQRILDREVYAGFGERTYIASGASFTVAQMFANTIVIGDGLVEVKPLDRDDPRGQTLNLTVLPLVLTSILAAIPATGLLFGFSLGRRIALAAALSLAGGLLAVLIVAVALSALPGSFMALWGVAALGIFAVHLPSGGLLRLLGQPGTIAPFMLFLMIGNPASGAATAPELLPTPWAELGQFLPPGALATALKNVAYFDGAALALPLAVLVAWALAGVALHVVAGRRERDAGPR